MCNSHTSNYYTSIQQGLKDSPLIRLFNKTKGKKSNQHLLPWRALIHSGQFERRCQIINSRTRFFFCWGHRIMEIWVHMDKSTKDAQELQMQKGVSLDQLGARMQQSLWSLGHPLAIYALVMTFSVLSTPNCYSPEMLGTQTHYTIWKSISTTIT